MAQDQANGHAATITNDNNNTKSQTIDLLDFLEGTTHINSLDSVDVTLLHLADEGNVQILNQHIQVFV